MERSKRIAIAFFDQFGFKVDDIPESNEQGAKRADVRAVDSTGREYITEVKDRLDAPDTVKSQQKTISFGDKQFTFRVSPMDHLNSLDKIFKSGSVQLDQTPANPNAFRLLWLHCNGVDASLQAIRARNTFYGIVPVMPDAGEEGRMCFYLDFSSSFMLPLVNGLVIVERREMILYVNEFARNADAFRNSELVANMNEAVFDPMKIVAGGEHLAFTSDISRKNESDVLEALREQTGSKYRMSRMSRLSF